MDQVITPKKSFLYRLRDKWQINSWWQMAVIIFVFSITGSLSVYLSKPILKFLGVHKETMNIFLYWLCRILITFPIYQLMLITIGSLCGQFKFFWKMEKKMISRFTTPFMRLAKHLH